jgi:hypothetical protein
VSAMQQAHSNAETAKMVMVPAHASLIIKGTHAINAQLSTMDQIASTCVMQAWI